MTGLQYTILHPWTGLSGKRAPFQGLAPEEERLLCAQDSMTTLLEGLYGQSVSVSAVVRMRRPLEAQSAAYLGVQDGGQALARGVWIRAGNEPLIFAFSLIPIETLDRAILAILEAGDPQPIGRTLQKEGVDFTKEAMEAGVIRCPLVAEGLGRKSEEAFFARQYLLLGRKKSTLVIKAAIIEVFSPRLISAEHLQP